MSDLSHVTMSEIARHTLKQVSETMFPGNHRYLISETMFPGKIYIVQTVFFKYPSLGFSFYDIVFFYVSMSLLGLFMFTCINY